MKTSPRASRICDVNAATITSDLASCASAAASTSTGRLFSTIPNSANHTSPAFGLVLPECIRPRLTLFFSRQQRPALHRYFERQSFPQFNLRQQHIHRIPGLHPQLSQNLFHLLQPPCRHPRPKQCRLCRHAQMCSKRLTRSILRLHTVLATAWRSPIINHPPNRGFFGERKPIKIMVRHSYS